MIFNSKKQYKCAGDAYPRHYTLKLDKDDYILKLQVQLMVSFVMATLHYTTRVCKVYEDLVNATEHYFNLDMHKQAFPHLLTECHGTRPLSNQLVTCIPSTTAVPLLSLCTHLLQRESITDQMGVSNKSLCKRCVHNTFKRGIVVVLGMHVTSWFDSGLFPWHSVSKCGNACLCIFKLKKSTT